MSFFKTIRLEFMGYFKSIGLKSMDFHALNIFLGLTNILPKLSPPNSNLIQKCGNHSSYQMLKATQTIMTAIFQGCSNY